MNRAHSAGPPSSLERSDTDRRRRVWWSVCYGNFNPRRRSPPRRLSDGQRFYFVDWHSSHLLAVALGVLILSAADAFFTLLLLEGGAAEVWRCSRR
jgi:hypothetical protein